MCDICRQIPCDARCPNAKDDVGDVECRMCKLPIHKGDRYLPTPEGSYCIEMLEKFLDVGMVGSVWRRIRGGIDI